MTFRIKISPTPSNTATVTPTKTPTSTICPELTPTVTQTQTQTATPTITPTETQTQTATPTVTATETATPTLTATQTATPTLTATQTATPTSTPIPLTPTTTPTVTPSPTACVSDCCFSATTNPISQGIRPIEIKPFPDGSLFLGNGLNTGTLNGVTLGFNSRIPSCGTPLGDYVNYNPGCITGFTTGVQSACLYQPQSNNSVFVQRGTIVYRYSSYTGYDTSFNESRVSGGTSPFITGMYVNNSDEIYVIGQFTGIRNCTGLTSYQTFNTNIYKLNANGDIDTSYSGISIGSIPNPGGGAQEPYVTTEKDPNGEVLVIGQSGFTGDSQWRGVLRLKANGLPDSSFNNNLFSAVTLTQLLGGYCQTDGKYMVFGSFTNLAGTGKSYVVRLNSDGTLDTGFTLSVAVGIKDLEQDIYGNYYTIDDSNVRKFNNSGTQIWNVAQTGGGWLSLAVSNCSVYAGGGATTRVSGVTSDFFKFDFNGNLNFCPLPSLTPTRTPTQTPTPTRTPTLTPTITLTTTNTTTPTATPTLTPTQTVTVTNTLTPSLTTTLTPTPSITSTSTPTNTATPSTTPPEPSATPTNTITPTNTATPTPTSTISCCQIDILTNSSLDVDIDTFDVDGTAATVIGGSLPNTPGNGTTLCSTITGTVDITVSTFNTTAGQKITLCDSNGTCSCYNITGTGPATWTWTDVVLNCSTPMTLIAEDGSC